jgi:hypothetical protein
MAMSSITKEALYPLQLWKNFVSSITKKLYNDMASNFSTNLQAKVANSHAGKQTNANN